MTWDGPNSFAYGVDALLAHLSPNGQAAGTKAFPETVDRAVVRFQGAESVRQWFERCVKAFMPEGLERWQIEPNLAAFAIVAWKPENQLDFATINVLKTECSLEDYRALTDEDLTGEWRELAKAHYLRLDLDYGTLGPIGTHPLPHVHFSPDDPPRFTLDASFSTNVVVDFMEFVYRHFFPKEWLTWAERTWSRHYKRTKRNPERNPFGRIVSAFADNEISVLHSLSKDVANVVAVLSKEKQCLYDLRMNAEDRRLLTFPDSRV